MKIPFTVALSLLHSCRFCSVCVARSQCTWLNSEFCCGIYRLFSCMHRGRRQIIRTRHSAKPFASSCSQCFETFCNIRNVNALSSSCFNAVVNLHSCFCQELSEILFHCYVCLHVFSALVLLVWRRDQKYTVGLLVFWQWSEA